MFRDSFCHDDLGIEDCTQLSYYKWFCLVTKPLVIINVIIFLLCTEGNSASALPKKRCAILPALLQTLAVSCVSLLFVRSRRNIRDVRAA
jgi:hypothetical protein